jgi:hypothetical protein
MIRNIIESMRRAALAGILLYGTAFAQVVPRPEDVLGFPVGADYHLATYTQAMDYLKRVASVSDRIKLFDFGRTSMGQVMTYAVITSPANMASLDKYKDISRRLSRATMPAGEAQELARKGKAVVYVDGGLHASECAPAQHNIQLAYDLITSSDARTLRILDDVILILVFANPDGMNLLAEWYHPNVGTPFEVSPMPRMYHKYAGHDNNRDSYIANLVETQNISRLVDTDWCPVILYNHHQTAPFPARIWTPPNSEPTNPNVHPLIVRWQNMIGSAMGAAFDAEGKEGAISRIVFDTWYPGYATQVVDSHNIISILTETALYEYATPHFYTVQDFPKEYQDLTMSAFYPSPWTGGWWRLKDAVDYCLTASMAVLDTASKYRAELLFNKYKMGSDVIARFRAEPPYAWIVPEKQTDPGTAALLLERMILLGVDVFRSEEAFSSDGIAYPKGTYVIPMAQANALFIKNVFEEQRYPDLRKYPDLWQGLVSPQKYQVTPFESYDMMGWTLPYQYGVQTRAANSPVDIRMSPMKEIRAAGKMEGGGGGAYLLDHSANAGATAVNRIFRAGGRVFWARKSFQESGRTFSEGTIVVPPAPGITAGFMNKLAGDLGLAITAASRVPDVEKLALRSPRVAVYQSWIPSEEEGWTRLVLEEHEFPFTSVHDAEIRAGNLEAAYDVVIIPDTWAPEIVLNGYAKGTMPEKYIGGITAGGVANLKSFAASGGTIIFMNGVCELAVEHFGLPVRNVLKTAKRDEFNCSGSILRAEFDTAHPIAYGMPREGGVVFSGSCAFDILPAFGGKGEPRTAVKYAGEDILMSGYIHGEKLIRDRAAVVEAPYGKGRVILLGFPATFRAQPRGTFKLLFNSVFYGAAKS